MIILRGKQLFEIEMKYEGDLMSTEKMLPLDYSTQVLPHQHLYSEPS